MRNFRRPDGLRRKTGSLFIFATLAMITLVFSPQAQADVGGQDDIRVLTASMTDEQDIYFRLETPAPGADILEVKLIRAISNVPGGGDYSALTTFNIELDQWSVTHIPADAGLGTEVHEYILPGPFVNYGEHCFDLVVVLDETFEGQPVIIPRTNACVKTPKLQQPKNLVVTPTSIRGHAVLTWDLEYSTGTDNGYPIITPSRTLIHNSQGYSHLNYYGLDRVGNSHFDNAGKETCFFMRFGFDVKHDEGVNGEDIFRPYSSDWSETVCAQLAD